MSLEEILAAHNRIRRHIHKTPVLHSKSVDDRVGRQVFFKCENLQKTGSFKVRGALNAILKLREENKSIPGIVCHSSGNHGVAVSWICSILNLPCAVVIPNVTSPSKSDAISAYDATVIKCENTPQSRYENTERIQKELGYIPIATSDDMDIIYGQATMAVELLDQVPDLDAILVPMSRGGMAAGVALATKYISPRTKVFIVEPEGKKLEVSLRAGKPMWEGPVRLLNTIADGMRFLQAGKLTFPIILKCCEKEVFSVNDRDIVREMKFIWQRMKLIIEPSAATGVAAVMSEKMKKMDPEIKKVGVILCGGNVDLGSLPW